LTVDGQRQHCVPWHKDIKNLLSVHTGHTASPDAKISLNVAEQVAPIRINLQEFIL
jgi:hypothetical protein